MFRDNYTDFWFDDKNSVAFNVWMTNQHDIQNNLSPTFTDKFTTPTYAQQRYYEGTTFSQQDLEVKCAAIGITRDDWRAIAEWFSPLKTGKLVFCWNPSHYYMVKVSKQPTNTIWALNRVDSVRGELYIVTFELQFTTVGDWAALTQPSVINFDLSVTNPEALERYKNEYYIPQMIMREADDTLHYLGNNTYALYGNVTCQWYEDYNGTTDYIFTLDGQPYAEITINTTNNKLCIKYSQMSNWIEEIPFVSGIATKIFYNLNYNYYYIASGTVYSSGPFDNRQMRIMTSIDKGLILLNTGSYDLFPKFYAVASEFTLYNKLENLYAVATINDTARPFEIDCQNGLVTSMGSIVNSLQIRGQRYFSDDCLAKSFIIDSGRPELLKGIVLSSSNIVLNSQSRDSLIDLKIRTNHAIKYSRENDYIMHIFTSVPQSLSARFDVDNYGWTENDKAFVDGNWDIENNPHYLSYNPIIKVDDDDHSIIHIYIETNVIYNNNTRYGNALRVNSLPIGTNIFISMCDINTTTYNLNGSMNVMLQCRDMM